jgi:hypothetical protein
MVGVKYCVAEQDKLSAVVVVQIPKSAIVHVRRLLLAACLPACLLAWLPHETYSVAAAANLYRTTRLYSSGKYFDAVVGEFWII